MLLNGCASDVDHPNARARRLAHVGNVAAFGVVGGDGPGRLRLAWMLRGKYHPNARLARGGIEHVRRPPLRPSHLAERLEERKDLLRSRRQVDDPASANVQWCEGHSSIPISITLLPKRLVMLLPM